MIGEKVFLRPVEFKDVDILQSIENNTDLWHLSNTLTPFSRFAIEQYIIEASTRDIYNLKQLRLMIAENQTKQVVGDYPISSAELVADKLEVYYFHRTARCYSCNTAGKYVSDLIIGTYGEQIKDGRIIFKELNVELPENKELARKYQATGSSLYINRIIRGQDNIEQETKIWRLLGNEQQFKSYLENKINSYLGI